MNIYRLMIVALSLPLAIHATVFDSPDWADEACCSEPKEETRALEKKSSFTLGTVTTKDTEPLKKIEPQTKQELSYICLGSGIAFGGMSIVAACETATNLERKGFVTLGIYSLMCATVSYQLLKNSRTTVPLDKLSTPAKPMTAANDYDLHPDNNDWMNP